MQHCRCQPNARQLGYAQVANDRRIREQEEWFGDEGAKGRKRQP
jgi:hypothetical protein